MPGHFRGTAIKRHQSAVEWPKDKAGRQMSLLDLRTVGYDYEAESDSFSAIRTRSGSDSACIFRMAWAR
jgi:hypothetical protein